jgi:hypothetical protein
MTRTKHLAATLAPVRERQQQVVFDVNNDEHMQAFEMLITQGKQHPTLRFRLEHPYVNVRAMMTEKVCRAHLATRKQNV